jgi:hypothetical protein
MKACVAIESAGSFVGWGCRALRAARSLAWLGLRLVGGGSFWDLGLVL